MCWFLRQHLKTWPTSDIVLRHRDEEKSLEILRDENNELAMEEGSGGKKVGRYLRTHLLHQVKPDIWWLVSGDPLFSSSRLT